MRAKDVASMIDAVHNERGERNLLQYRLADLQDTEHALLQLLDFDILSLLNAFNAFTNTFLLLRLSSVSGIRLEVMKRIGLDVINMT